MSDVRMGEQEIPSGEEKNEGGIKPEDNPPAAAGSSSSEAVITDKRAADAVPPASRDLLLDRLRANAAKDPSKRAVAFLAPARGPPGAGTEIVHELTYSGLERETSDLAATLLGSGLQRGDRAVLVYPPSLNFTVAFIACLKAGVVAVPVFPPNPVRRDSLRMFAAIVEACDARHALTDSGYNHQKKLAGIRDALAAAKFQKSKTRTAVPAWPESLTWIVTDNKQNSNSSSSTNAKGSSNKLHKKKGKQLARAAGEEGAETTENNDGDDDNNSSKVDVRSQLAFLQFTSGSTSDPKGVMITHGNMAHNLHCITSELRAGSDTVVVSWLPQYHDMGLIGSVLGCLYCGGTGYYMSPLTFLRRPAVWVEAVSEHRATHLQAPNFAYKLAARKFLDGSPSAAAAAAAGGLDLSSVRHAINAAEPVDQHSMDAFYETFAPYGFGRVIYPTYGLAEHTVFVCSGGKQILRVLKKELEVDGVVVVLGKDDNHEKGGASSVSTMVGCGYPSAQGIDVKIVNVGTFASVSDDVVGEIWVRSPSKAAGYYRKPQETRDDFHAVLSNSPDVGNGDGYLRTGDLGFMHNDELFICGRLKDLIIVGGRNYYPQDIEATAEASSDLVRLGCSAAFTIDPTHEGGEEVALVMELKEVPASKEVESICAPLANQIRSAINQEHSLGISSIAFLKTRTVPKTSSGKIARAWCRKGYVAGTLQVVYQKLFKSDPSPLEIEQTNGTQLPERKEATTTKDAATIRAMSKEDILNKLINDVSVVGSIPADSVDKKAPLVHILDSLTISQFKGMLENNYAVKISDEYLFRESTTVAKLVEVAKLGYAPDDADGDAAAMAAGPGQARGLAGALGCPPGVVCVIL